MLHKYQDASADVGKSSDCGRGIEVSAIMARSIKKSTLWKLPPVRIFIAAHIHSRVYFEVTKIKR